MKTKLCLIIAMFFSFVMYTQTVIVEGPVEGTWTLAGSPYQVTGTTTIENGKTLTIEPGVVVEWQGSYSMHVQGQILAQGTEADSITFTAEDPSTGFRSLRFVDTPASNDSSLFEYCIFKYGKVYGTYPDNCGGAIAARNFGKFVVDHCLFKMNTAIEYNIKNPGGGAIALWTSTARITNSTFNNNTSIGGGAIVCFRNSDPLIRNNLFTGNEAIDTDLGQGFGGAIICNINSDPVIEYNTFTENLAHRYGGAISVVDKCSPVIDHNLIYENTAWETGGGIDLTSECSPLIINNTIVDNHANGVGGGMSLSIECAPMVKNTIFWGNTTSADGAQVYIISGNCIPDFYYSDIKGGKDSIGNNQFIGHYVGNIDDNPLFENPDEDDYHLTQNSPCIDTGDPEMYDPDGTRCDIGAFYYQVVGFPEFDTQDTKIVIDCYPNPAQGLTNICYITLHSGYVELCLYDLSGRKVITLVNAKQNAGVNTLTFDTSKLPSGIFFLSLQSGDKHITKKLLIN